MSFSVLKNYIYIYKQSHIKINQAIESSLFTPVVTFHNYLRANITTNRNKEKSTKAFREASTCVSSSELERRNKLKTEKEKSLLACRVHV